MSPGASSEVKVEANKEVKMEATEAEVGLDDEAKAVTVGAVTVDPYMDACTSSGEEEEGSRLARPVSNPQSPSPCSPPSSTDLPPLSAAEVAPPTLPAAALTPPASEAALAVEAAVDLAIYAALAPPTLPAAALTPPASEAALAAEAAEALAIYAALDAALLDARAPSVAEAADAPSAAVAAEAADVAAMPPPPPMPHPPALPTCSDALQKFLRFHSLRTILERSELGATALHLALEDLRTNVDVTAAAVARELAQKLPIRLVARGGFAGLGTRTYVRTPRG